MQKLSLIVAAGLIATASALPALAEGGGKVDPAKEQTLAKTLKQEGYDVRSMTMEDGFIEVYAMKGGKRTALYFNASTLKQVKRKGDEG